MCRYKTLNDEIGKSHVLLFHNTDSSRKLEQQFYGRLIRKVTQGEEAAMLATESLYKPIPYMMRYQDENVHCNLSAHKIVAEFPYLAPYIAILLDKMEHWKPRGFAELFIPEYYDCMRWWMSMFAIFFGITSLVGVGLAAWQGYLAQRALDIALQSA